MYIYICIVVGIVSRYIGDYLGFNFQDAFELLAPELMGSSNQIVEILGISGTIMRCNQPKTILLNSWSTL
jgi:hypothetical protein